MPSSLISYCIWTELPMTMRMKQIRFLFFLFSNFRLMGCLSGYEPESLKKSYLNLLYFSLRYWVFVWV